MKTRWSSKLTYIMAAAGAAIGLGNIWRFPYIAGANGGGAFVLVYIACAVILGLPLLMAEVSLGRLGRANPFHGMQRVAEKTQQYKAWRWLGGLCLLTGFLILSYYAVITGWVLDYLFHGVFNSFIHITPIAASTLLNNLFSDPIKMLLWDTLAIFIIVFIIGRGVHHGLEKAVYFLFPSLIIISIALLFYALKMGSFDEGLLFLFKPDFHKLTAHGMLLALGQAFFSVGIAMGILMTFGAYLSDQTSILKTSAWVVFADTAVALTAGMTIFPIVFANHMQPAAGPSLIFKTVPVAFGAMPFGDLFATLFFLMLALAALTSAIALLEPLTVWAMETFKWPRTRASASMGFAVWLVSLGSVFSFNMASHLTIHGKTFFDCVDYITSNWMLPLGGLLITILTGWCINKKDSAKQVGLKSKSTLHRTWIFMLRAIVPTAILSIMISHTLKSLM